MDCFGFPDVTHLHKHKRTAGRLDTNSPFAAQFTEIGHDFNLQGATVIGRGSSKAERLMLEVWHLDANSINKHLDLSAAYKVLRHYENEGLNKTKKNVRIANEEDPTASHSEEEAALPVPSTG